MKIMDFVRKPIIFLVAGLVLLSMLVPAPAQAQTTSTAAVPNDQDTTYLTDPEEVEAFWDVFFAQQMVQFGVHGAVMVMVKDGKVFFAKGYGYTNAAQQTPYDPGQTILRAGSLVKTVTATAIMQLAERGEINLDEDVNHYLTAFKIPDTFEEPVTARHLINMTGGFDTRLFGVRVSSADEVQPLGEYLAKQMPPRTRPPGHYRRYNDHEVALAGYLAEVVSGMPYEDYVREHIFSPLQMNSSSILLPDDQVGRAARGYPVGGGPGDAYPLSYYYLNDAPGAGFNTTALDLANYMIANLKDGEFVGKDGLETRILAKETAQALHKTAFSYHPLMKGQANSWDEEFFNGHRYLLKSGGAPGINNQMILLKDQGLGFYLNYNSDGYALVNKWRDEIEKMYLSTPEAPAVEVDATLSPIEGADRYAGYYRVIHDDTADTNLIKINTLIGSGMLRVTPGDGSGLTIGNARYVAIESGVFQAPSSGTITTFETDETGYATYLFMNRFFYERVPWYEAPPLQFALLAFSILIFLSSAIAWVVSLVRGRSASRWLSGLVSFLYLLFLISLLLVMLPAITGRDVWQFFFDPSPQLLLVLAIPLLATSLAAGMLIQTILAWRDRRNTVGVRLHNSLVLAGVLAFLFFLNTWNLLGYRF